MPRTTANRAARFAVGETAARTYYDVLQVSPRAELPVLLAAYRALARASHPDLNSSAAAAASMRELNEAFEVLSDPRRRTLYDLSLHQQPAESPPAAPPRRVRRRTLCWRCSTPLEGAYAQYCGECHWIICLGCGGCGCEHPTWRRKAGGARRRLQALGGWILAVLLGLGWLASSEASEARPASTYAPAVFDWRPAQPWTPPVQREPRTEPVQSGLPFSVR